MQGRTERASIQVAYLFETNASTARSVSRPRASCVLQQQLRSRPHAACIITPKTALQHPAALPAPTTLPTTPSVLHADAAL